MQCTCTWTSPGPGKVSLSVMRWKNTSLSLLITLFCEVLGMKNLTSYPVIAPNALLGACHTTTEQLPSTKTPMGASAPVLTIVT